MARLVALALVLAPAPAVARDNLGVFGAWGAFRDPSVPRCYAIALAERGKASSPATAFASVGTWPRRGIRGQLYFRTSRPIAKGAMISVVIGRRSFALTGAGTSAWAPDRQGDAAILAALRAAPSFRVRSITTSGRAFSDTYRLDGVASALDAATVGCARLR